MKAHMKRQMKLFMLAMLCIVLVVPAMNVSAVTQRQKAINAYKKYMAQSKVYVLPKGSQGPVYLFSGNKTTYNGTPASKVKFCIANIDNDSIPELVINCKLGLRSDIPAYTILTYKDGKIRRVTYETYASFKGYYPKTGIYINHHITEGELIYINYIRMKGLRTTEVMYKGDWGSLKYTSDDYKDWYNIGEKDCSAKTFAAYRSKITGGKSLIKVKMHSNTATNRNLKIR